MSAGTPTTSLAVGIDIGGTKVKVCAADVSGRILAIQEIPSGPDRDAHDLLHDVKACVDLVVGRAAAQGASLALKQTGLMRSRESLVAAAWRRWSASSAIHFFLTPGSR